MGLIDIYAMHFYQNGSIQENKTLLQTIPAKSEGELYFVNPKVSTKVGNAESFDFSIQPNTKYYDAFIQMRTYFYVEYDGDLIFYGRVLTIENGFYGEQRIKCEGAFAFFNDSYFPGKDESQRETITTGQYINSILTNHNEQLNDPLRSIYPGEVPGYYTAATSSEQRIEEETRAFGENGWRQTKSALDDLTSHYGGMFRIRHGSNNKLYLDWYKHYYKSEINSQIIELGKNLIDVTHITEVNNIFTVVIPIGKKNKDKNGKNSDGEDKLYIDGLYFPVSRVFDFYTIEELTQGYHLPEDYLEAESKYGRIIKPQEFQECTTVESLEKECAKWVKENYQGGIEEFSISAVDLHQIGNKNVSKILAGDRNIIRYPGGDGKVKQRTLTCTAVTFELYNPENNQYSFGIPASSLSKGYSVNSTKSSKDAEEALKDMPTYGGGGGDVDPYHIWYNEKLSWLKSHRVWWRHLSIKEREQHSMGLGPNGDNFQSCFIHEISVKDDEGDYLAEVWVPLFERKQNLGTDLEPKWVYVWMLDHGRPVGRWKRIKRKVLKDYSYDLKSDHLMEYVYDEYGNDLSEDMPLVTSDMIDSITELMEDPSKFFDSDLGETFLNVGETFLSYLGVDKLKKYASWGTNLIEKYNILGLKDNPIFQKIKGFTDSEGTTTTSVLGFGNGTTILGTVTEFVGGLFNIKTTVIDDNGNIETSGQVKTGGPIVAAGQITSDGDIIFTAEDGTKVSSKDMKKIQIRQDDRENAFGSIVERFFFSEDPDKAKIVQYEFNQVIEHYGGGEVVVAKVEGDQVILGGVNAHTVIETALENVSHVCGEFEYYKDPKTGARTVTMKEGSGLFMTRDGTEYGVYHEGNLTGGIIVKKVNGSEVETHIVGNKILVGDKSGSYYAGYISDDHLHFYSDEEKQHEIEDHSSSKFYGDIPSDKVYTWNGSVFVETSKTLDLQTSNMKGMIGTKATVTELNAAKARISTLEADLISTTKIDARIASLSVIHGHALELDGFGGTSYIMSQYYYKGKPGNAKLMDSIIRNLKVVSAGTNKYKIQYQTYDDTDEVWHDASGTFDRASLLKGSWSGGIFTVSEDSSGTTAPISSSNLRYNKTGNVSKSSKTVSQKIDLQYFENVPGTSTQWHNTGFSASVSIDASSVWTDGNTEGWNSGYDNASGKVKIDGVVTLNTSHPLNYGASSTVEVPVNMSGTRTSIVHTFSAPANNYQTGWNDGYDNAASKVKVDGVSTLNTSHTIAPAGSSEVIVPVNTSGTRTTLTHKFTARLPDADNELNYNGNRSDEERDSAPTDPIVKNATNIVGAVWIKRADNKWVRLKNFSFTHGLTYTKVVRTGSTCTIYGKGSSGSEVQIASGVPCN